MSSSPYINPQLIKYDGTSAKSGSLDATGVSNVALGHGVWEIWATCTFQIQINAATGAGFGANPSTYPADQPIPVPVIAENGLYLAIRAITGASGTYYANKISGSV